jgi:hypothetical protein
MYKRYAPIIFILSIILLNVLFLKESGEHVAANEYFTKYEDFYTYVFSDTNICGELLPLEEIVSVLGNEYGKRCMSPNKNSSSGYIPNGISDENCARYKSYLEKCINNTPFCGSEAFNCYRITPKSDNRNRLHPLVETFCTEETVGGIGYPNLTFDPTVTTYKSAFTNKINLKSGVLFGLEVHNINIHLFEAFSVIEQILDQLYGVVGYEETGAKVYNFPSGSQSIQIQLGASESATEWSPHHPGNGGVAADINGRDNTGNILGYNPYDVTISIPPEFVFVVGNYRYIAEKLGIAMPEILNSELYPGIYWGGNFTTTGETEGACDPMHYEINGNY